MDGMSEVINEQRILLHCPTPGYEVADTPVVFGCTTRQPLALHILVLDTCENSVFRLQMNSMEVVGCTE